jgi:hypothetical protein
MITEPPRIAGKTVRRNVPARRLQRNQTNIVEISDEGAAYLLEKIKNLTFVHVPLSSVHLL